MGKSFRVKPMYVLASWCMSCISEQEWPKTKSWSSIGMHTTRNVDYQESWVAQICITQCAWISTAIQGWLYCHPYTNINGGYRPPGKAKLLVVAWKCPTQKLLLQIAISQHALLRLDFSDKKFLHFGRYAFSLHSAVSLQCLNIWLGHVG